jgi:outer membrane protein assembly factor BamD (BamD/ComL family)
MKRILTLCLVLTLSLWFIGCSGRPVEQEQRTKTAMEQAKAEYASEFAAEDWKAAEQAYADANTSLEKGSWGPAQTQLMKAESRYKKARDTAKAKKDDLIREVSSNRKAAELRYEKLKEKIGKTKLAPAKKQDLDEACKEIEGNLAKIDSQLKTADFNQAKYNAGNTLRLVWEAEKTLEGTAAKK